MICDDGSDEGWWFGVGGICTAPAVSLLGWLIAECEIMLELLLGGELVGAVDGGAGDDWEMSLTLESICLSSLRVSRMVGRGDSGVIASCPTPAVVFSSVMVGELSDSAFRCDVTGDDSGAATVLGVDLD
jgi:hypothetical protein